MVKTFRYKVCKGQRIIAIEGKGSLSDQTYSTFWVSVLHYALVYVHLNISLPFQMCNFTSFAMVLNEIDKEMESTIPKTDCRLRPDIRAMENGEIGN